jgi:hypothetical protein
LLRTEEPTRTDKLLLTRYLLKVPVFSSPKTDTPQKRRDLLDPSEVEEKEVLRAVRTERYAHIHLPISPRSKLTHNRVVADLSGYPC